MSGVVYTLVSYVRCLPCLPYLLSCLFLSKLTSASSPLECSYQTEAVVYHPLAWSLRQRRACTKPSVPLL